MRYASNRSRYVGRSLSFFTRLYEDQESKGWIQLCQFNPTKIIASLKTTDLNEISKILQVKENRHDLYFTVAPRCKELKKKLGDEQNISCLTSIWCDVDIKKKQRKNAAKLYFETSHEACSWMMNDLPLKPSILVWSGYGWHAYWVLKEPFVINNDEDLKDAKQLVCGWSRYVASRTTNEIDIVNLTGVLRVPDTFNCKSEDSTPVVTVRYPESLDEIQTYNASEFWDYVDLFPVQLKIDSERIDRYSKDIALTPHANAPREKFSWLLKDNPKFKKTWERCRTDLKDPSSSGYCQSLADIAVAAGWQDQEIVNLIVEWRSKHGFPLKLDRPKWYATSLAKAKEYMDEAIKLESINSTEDRARKIIEKLESLLEVSIISIERHKPPFEDVSEDSQYLIKTSKGNILIPSTSDLLSSKTMKSRLASSLGKLLPNMKSQVWDEFAQAILTCASTVLSSSESSKYRWVDELLTEYIGGKPIYEDMERFSNNGKRGSFKDDDGKTCFSFKEFRKWMINNTTDRKWSNQELSSALSFLGWSQEKANVTVNGKRTTLMYWRLR